MSQKKRISITVPVRSIGLKNFVEKAIKDDGFFRLALENPLGAMDECGVKIDESSIRAKDFAAFFGALSGVKEMVKKKNIKDLTFEGIFGKAFVEIGIVAFADQKSETSQSSNKEWSNKDAMRETRSESGWNKNFDKASWGEIHRGPLIHPEDLVVLAARIKTFTDIVEQVE
ncbi:MAG: hypothetical protein HW406_1185 [Candidatus Brocadiaceae bacterium]|nr:hypothetical protein [Candidatus Brocadiaceae bacterium]